MRGFVDVLPELLTQHDATHGVQWADYDGNGTLDLALTGAEVRVFVAGTERW